MSDAPQRYPLAWPPHRKRTALRRTGRFNVKGEDWRSKPVSVTEAIRRADNEVERLGGRWPILSSNLEVRMDGSPVLNRGMPGDPGVCLYFDLKGKPIALACDTYTDVAQNIAAVAAHLEATRAIERYGVATAAESLQAFAALPPPPEATPKRPWWEVLGVARDSVDGDDLKAVFKVRAQKWHPDKEGGSAEKMAELNVALAEGLAEVGQ